MEVQISKTADVLVVEVSGDIDLYVAPDLHSAYMNAVEKYGGCNCLIDLAKTHYLDSSGIGVLFRIFSDTHSRGCKFCLCGVTGMVKQLLSLSRMSALFPIETDRAAAMRRISQ
jgi:anti-anti-sigma factor